MAKDTSPRAPRTRRPHRSPEYLQNRPTTSQADAHAQMDALVAGQAQVLELIMQEAPLSSILDAIIHWVEAQARDELQASILLTDADGAHLLHGAAPSLPDAYNSAINGIAIGPQVGSCGTAAYIREPVIVADVAEDPLWQDFRELALAHGLRACWSTPLLGGNGAVLGTFAIYYRAPRRPTEDDLRLIQLVTRTAVLAIEHQRAATERERLQAHERQMLVQARVEWHELYDLFMQAPAVIAVMRGPTHIFELANPLCIQAIGFGREVLGKPVREALPEIAGQGFVELLDTVYATGKPYFGNEILVKLDRRGDGVLADGYFNFVYQPNTTAQGETIGILIHAVEVTEMVQARKRVEDSEVKFRALADNITQLAWMADPSGWIYWYNQRWYEYTGATPAEMEGWGWQSVHDPQTLPHVMERWTASIATGQPFDMVFPLKGADGVFRPFLTRIVPVKDAQGHVMHWFGTNTDVTEQRRLEQLKDEFIGMASHELKTPITSLKTYAQVMALRFRKSGDQRSAELLEKMDGQLNKLNSLVGDLLDVTKIESGKLQLQETMFDYSELVAEIVEETQRTAAQHTIRHEGVRPMTVQGDRDRIGQVLTNLITNAIKYSPQADTVIITTYLDGAELVTAVQDFGIGIPAAKQAQVFERFFRVEGDQQATFPGLGLGLYISAEIVRRHQGRMWLESDPGNGSTFFFALPLTAAVPQEASAEGTSDDA